MCTKDILLLSLLYLLFAFVRSSRVSHYGFYKDQRARLVEFADSCLLKQACSVWSSFSLEYVTQIFKFYFTEPQFYRLEGVWLTESGMSLLRSMSMSPLHKRRQRRSRLGTLCCEGGPDGMDLREVEGDGERRKGWHTRVALEQC